MRANQNQMAVELEVGDIHTRGDEVRITDLP